jgi:chemotaxis protein CheD
MDTTVKRIQLRPTDVDALQLLSQAATEHAAENLSRFVGAEVQVDRPQLRVDSLASAASLVASLPQRTSMVLVRVTGDIAGDLLLVLPESVERALLRMLGVPRGDEELRSSALRELGNIVLGGYLVPLVSATKLDARPSVPLLGSGDPSALLQPSLARAACDDDVVLSVDTTFALEGDGLPHRRMHVMFLPAPGSLARVLAHVPEAAGADDVYVIVHMGELAVARRPGDVLVARGLGSCVAVALLDECAGVATLAHVMLPTAPAAQLLLRRRATYPARYANTVVPALIEALERAGGTRRQAKAVLVGGGQMFDGVIDADDLQIHERNVEGVLDGLRDARIAISGQDTGGTNGRMLEIHVDPMSVTCSIPVEGRTVRFLDAA